MEFTNLSTNNGNLNSKHFLTYDLNHNTSSYTNYIQSNHKTRIIVYMFIKTRIPLIKQWNLNFIGQLGKWWEETKSFLDDVTAINNSNKTIQCALFKAKKNAEKIAVCVMSEALQSDTQWV